MNPENPRFSPTLTVQICGGLGNQLFCYAAGRAIALRNRARLCLDTTSGFVADYYQREYLLDHFRVQGDRLTAGGPSQSSVNVKFKQRFIAKLNALLPLRFRSLVSENGSGFDARIRDLRLRRPVTLVGLWQDERYFADCTPALREDLQVAVPPSGEAMCLAERMDPLTSVSIHYRSYAEAPGVQRLLGAEYFQRAVQHIRAIVSHPHFFVFSDRPDLAREVLGTTPEFNYVGVTQVRSNRSAVEDLWLMSRCKHHVVANSTFSWWGAWLAEREGSIIIRPASGHAVPRDELYPARWTILQ